MQTAMRRATLVLALVGLATALGSCARRSKLMTATGPAGTVVAPAAGKALVVFLRPGRYGGAVQAVLYDGDALVGISSVGTAINYQATAGKHQFMVVSEVADFLDAELAPDKTYFVLVERGMDAGRARFWQARFTLRKLDPRKEASDIARWRHDARPVATNERAVAWDRENRPGVLRKRDIDLRKWHEKPTDARPTLHTEDGI
jgi:hypothetical protein